MSMRATLTISRDHPAFAGHFPNFPVLPGAVLLDETLELMRRTRGLDLTRWQVTTAKFLGPVHPGECLEVEHDAPRGGLIRFTVRAGERVVASGSLGGVPS